MVDYRDDRVAAPASQPSIEDKQGGMVQLVLDQDVERRSAQSL
jgi:hypothetical protein